MQCTISNPYSRPRYLAGEIINQVHDSRVTMAYSSLGSHNRKPAPRRKLLAASASWTPLPLSHERAPGKDLSHKNTVQSFLALYNDRSLSFMRSTH
jgi:hypothetical protein